VAPSGKRLQRKGRHGVIYSVICVIHVLSILRLLNISGISWLDTVPVTQAMVSRNGRVLKALTQSAFFLHLQLQTPKENSVAPFDASTQAET